MKNVNIKDSKENILNKLNKIMDKDCIDEYGFRIKSPKETLVTEDIIKQ